MSKKKTHKHRMTIHCWCCAKLKYIAAHKGWSLSDPHKLHIDTVSGQLQMIHMLANITYVQSG
jgi:hypothetical protein